MEIKPERLGRARDLIVWTAEVHKEYLRYVLYPDASYARCVLPQIGKLESVLRQLKEDLCSALPEGDSLRKEYEAVKVMIEISDDSTYCGTCSYIETSKSLYHTLPTQRLFCRLCPTHWTEDAELIHESKNKVKKCRWCLDEHPC